MLHIYKLRYKIKIFKHHLGRIKKVRGSRVAGTWFRQSGPNKYTYVLVHRYIKYHRHSSKNDTNQHVSKNSSRVGCDYFHFHFLYNGILVFSYQIGSLYIISVYNQECSLSPVYTDEKYVIVLLNT